MKKLIILVCLGLFLSGTLLTADDNDNITVFPPFTFEDGLALACRWGSERMRFGFIDKTGKEVITLN